MGGLSGENIINCEGKALDVNFVIYYWNGERVDPFIYNIEIINKTVEETVNNYYGGIKNIEGDYTEIKGDVETLENKVSKFDARLGDINIEKINIKIILSFILSIALSYKLIMRQIQKKQ